MSRLLRVTLPIVLALAMSSAAERPRAHTAAPEDADPLSARAAWAATLASRYRVTSNITYFTAGGRESTLDVYQPAFATAATPTLMYFHGGGWSGMSRTAFWLHTLPYLEMGWAVVNVSYRITPQARAPAAVEDCRCALRWVIANAAKHNFDVDKIVVSGMSAGAHLALTTGMLPASAGFDQQCPPCLQWKCPANEEMKVAAIVNWFGITDVGDLLQGPNTRVYALAWAGGANEHSDLGRRVSPVTYVRPGLPATVTVHGTRDPSVPYAHATRLHSALTNAGVPNKLITIENGTHGGFTRDDTLAAHATIRAFLAEHGLGPVTNASAPLSETATFAVMASRQYGVVPNVTYLMADGWRAQLDVYPGPPIAGRPAPALIYFHGTGLAQGGASGDRTAGSLGILPYLEMGWTVVNVDTRPAWVSLAPGAVEDGRCVLRWVIRHAKEYRLDVDRIVVSGRGPGAHLALTTGMLPASAGLDRRCPGSEELKVAAIINWGGMTDVTDLLDGPNMRDDTIAWFASVPNRDQLARQVSPLTYVRAGLPPILTIHRDADPVVPASHATRLHADLTKTDVRNTLVRLAGGTLAPDAYSRDDVLKAYRAVHAFLAEHRLLGTQKMDR